jgi:hypothetical protein
MTVRTENARRADQTSVKYPLTSPLVVAGEESPSEASIRERSIELLFSKKDLKSEAHRTAFAKTLRNAGYTGFVWPFIARRGIEHCGNDVETWYKAGLFSLSRGCRHEFGVILLAASPGCGWWSASAAVRIKMAGRVRYSIRSLRSIFSVGAKEFLLDGGDANKGIIEQTLEIMARMGLYQMNGRSWRTSITWLSAFDAATIATPSIARACDRRRISGIRAVPQTDAPIRLFVAYKPVRINGELRRAYVLGL